MTLVAGSFGRPGGTSRLFVISYHYVRDLPKSRFPAIKGLLTDDFRRQVDALRSRYEMADWRSVLAFIRGDYKPERDLCFLTFDDGLKDHLTDVLPILLERRLTGAFFITTRCADEGWVATVHKNHFLMAELEFRELQRRFTRTFRDLSPEVSIEVEADAARQAYRWDSPEVASYKYLVNHKLPVEIREQVVEELFLQEFGSEEEFGRELYMGWAELRQMQESGMVIGGHTHTHRSLGSLPVERQREELQCCAELLDRNLGTAPAGARPFCYPYGKQNAFTPQTLQLVKEIGYGSGFTTMVGAVEARDDPFRLRRFDTNHVNVDNGLIRAAC